jgi:hypothetical protein
MIKGSEGWALETKNFGSSVFGKTCQFFENGFSETHKFVLGRHHRAILWSRPKKISSKQLFHIGSIYPQLLPALRV